MRATHWSSGEGGVKYARKCDGASCSSHIWIAGEFGRGESGRVDPLSTFSIY
jgi:hypothetical protein